MWCPTSAARSGSSEVMICQNEVKSEALHVAADARMRARQSIRGLRRLLEGFPPSQTPKILAYISEGLVTQGEPSQLPWLDGKAAAAHVTIYPLRLEVSEFDASQRRPPAKPLADRAVQEQGLAILAQATGGDLYRMISNSDSAFRRLSAELSGYYLLGFEPDARDRNGRPHAISVDVRRRGVTVRSRRQFTIPTRPSRQRRPRSSPLYAIRSRPSKSLSNSPRIHFAILGTKGCASSRRRDRSLYQPRRPVLRGLRRSGFRRQAGGQPGGYRPTLAGSTPQACAAVLRPRLGRPWQYTVKLVVVDDAGRRGSVERVAAPS